MLNFIEKYVEKNYNYSDIKLLVEYFQYFEKFIH